MKFNTYTQPQSTTRMTTAERNERKATELLNKAGIGRLWEVYLKLPLYGNSDERYAGKLVKQLLQYGNLTFGAERWGEPSAEIVKTITDLIYRIDNKEILEAERAQRNADAVAKYAARVAEWERAKADALDCPSGRVEVTGKILKVQAQVTNWGTTTKILILADEGYTVWCTAPKGSYPRQRDTRITLSVDIDEDMIDHTTKHGYGLYPKLITHHAERTHRALCSI